MSTEAIVLLKSIDASLRELVKIARGRQAKPIATDRDLDGKYGDPELKFTVRDWTGPSYKGRHFSECPPELLDQIADVLDWFAEKAEANSEQTSAGKPVAGYRRADAARARGWAKRMRDGKVLAPAASSNGDGDEWASDGDGF